MTYVAHCRFACRCRPVRVVQPPAENVCLVGQQSGRIKWIQPSGAPPLLIIRQAPSCMLLAHRHSMHANKGVSAVLHLLCCSCLLALGDLHSPCQLLIGTFSDRHCLGL